MKEMKRIIKKAMLAMLFAATGMMGLSGCGDATGNLTAKPLKAVSASCNGSPCI